MNTNLTGVVVGGELKLDQPLLLPDQSRVRVTIQSDVSNEGWRQALESLRRLAQQQPISSGGLRYSRDELHERD